MVTDDEVLAAIEKVRADEGACSLRALGDELGISHTGARYRVQRLEKRGQVTQTGTSGGIRIVGAEVPRETEVLRGRLVLQVSYDPQAAKPLQIEVLEADGPIMLRAK